MNLSKLFKIQSELDKRIVKEHGLEGQDLLDKKILALQVELGELANEWRGFKFWSEDQKPRTKLVCRVCHETGEVFQPIGGHPMECPHCDGTGLEEEANPLLEEYVDCLHFILSIGNDLGVVYEVNKIMDYEKWNTIQLLSAMYYQLAMFENENHNKAPRDIQINAYRLAFNVFLSIGKRLGFTWEQIEQAYMQKNEINHERQNNGY